MAKKAKSTIKRRQQPGPVPAPKAQPNQETVPVSKQTVGGVTGAILGAAVAGPFGAIAGGLTGAVVGDASAKGKKPIKRAVDAIRSEINETHLGDKLKSVTEKVTTKIKSLRKGRKKTALAKKQAAPAVRRAPRNPKRSRSKGRQTSRRRRRLLPRRSAPRKGASDDSSPERKKLRNAAPFVQIGSLRDQLEIFHILADGSAQLRTEKQPGKFAALALPIFCLDSKHHIMREENTTQFMRSQEYFHIGDGVPFIFLCRQHVNTAHSELSRDGPRYVDVHVQ
jgi:hypothetical protein